MLRKSESVERRSIEETDAAGVGCLQCRLRALLRDALVEIAERRAAHAKHADLQLRSAKLPQWKPAHMASLDLIGDHRH